MSFWDEAEESLHTGVDSITLQCMGRRIAGSSHGARDVTLEASGDLWGRRVEDGSQHSPSSTHG